MHGKLDSSVAELPLAAEIRYGAHPLHTAVDTSPAAVEMMHDANHLHTAADILPAAKSSDKGQAVATGGFPVELELAANEQLMMSDKS